MTKMHQRIRTESGRQVVRVTSAINKFTPQLTASLEAALGEDGWDVPAECVADLQQALGRVLESRLDTLRDRVDTRRQGVHEGKRLRRQRDEAAREVYRLLVRLRHMVRGLGGVEAERAYFGSGKTPREPKPLALAAWELQQRMTSDSTLHNVGRRFDGEAVLAQWAREVDAPLSRLFELLDQVALLEVDETKAVDEIQRAREGMQRAQKNVLKLMEAFYGLADRDDLAEKLRVREPAARDAKESASARSAEVAETPDSDPQAVPTDVAPSRELDAASDSPGAAAAEAEGSLEAFQPATRARPGAERVAVASREVPSEQRAVGDTEPPSSATPHVEPAERSEPEVSTHPVRKVLRWLSVVPHRVETAEDPGASAASREEAA